MSEEDPGGDKLGPGPLTGTTLLHYEFGDRLGVGGMGEVYLATDLRLRRKIAIKVLPPDMGHRARRLKRFQREAEILAGLKHPNIMTLFGVEEHEGLRFLTLELIEGPTLSELVPDDGMSVQEFFRYARPIAHALAAAHESRITHRDLKPSNVMVEAKSGIVKVLDFGVAKESHEHDFSKPPSTVDETIPMVTQAGGMVGTVPYMSPEQLRGEEATPRSDVFALGSLFHEMATGKRPFSALSQAELMAKIMRDPAPGIRELNPRYPPLVERIVDRCLEKAPEDRYANAGEVAAELDELAQGVDSGALTAPLVMRGLLPAQPRKRWLALGGLLAVALLLALVAWKAFDRRAQGAASGTSAGEIPAFVRLITVPMEVEGSLEYEHTVRGVEESLRRTLLEVPRLHLSEVSSGELPGEWSPAAIEDLLARSGADAVLRSSVEWSEEQLAGVLAMHLVGKEELGLDWRQDYATRPENRAEVNARIAADVARQLHLLQPGDTIDPAPMTQSPQAEAAYLRGLNLRRIGALDAANLALQDAVGLDSEFGLAWAELAVAEIETYGNAGRYPPAPPIGTNLERMAVALDNARRLAPTDPKTRLAEALYLARVEHQYERALERFEALLAGTPNRADLLLGYARALRSAGRFQDAVQQLELARRLHRDDPEIRDRLAWFRLIERRYEEAEEMARALLELVPGRSFALEVLQPALLASGKPVEQLAQVHETFRRDGHSVHSRLALQLAVVQGDWALASRRLSERRQVRYRRGDDHGWLHGVDLPYAAVVARHADLDFDWRNEAREALRSLEEQFPQDERDPMIRNLAALTSAALGEAERARGLLAEAARLAENDPVARVFGLECSVRVEVLLGAARRAGDALASLLALESGTYWSKTYVERDPTLSPALAGLPDGSSRSI